MGNVSMREAYGRALAEYGELNQNVVVLDADTSSSTLSNFFAKKFPQRFINVGIAEPCMVDVAVGMALEGMIPFVNGFAALLSLRALEQVRTCICYAQTNVKLAASYAGVSAFKDGPTHHSITDIAIMRSLPEMTVIVPADSVEAASWVPTLAKYDRPVYFRLSRAVTVPVHQEGLHLDIGKGLILRKWEGFNHPMLWGDGGLQPEGCRNLIRQGNPAVGHRNPYNQAAGYRAGDPGRGRNQGDCHRRGTLGDRWAGRGGGRNVEQIQTCPDRTGWHSGYLCADRAQP